MKLLRGLLKLLGVLDDVGDAVELGAKAVKAIDDTDPIPLSHSPRQIRPTTIVPPPRRAPKK